MSACVCEWPESCGGMGTLCCQGCGGDLCVCACGGETVECPGCDDCREDWEGLDDAEGSGDATP
jgi:hypothetical protein